MVYFLKIAIFSKDKSEVIRVHIVGKLDKNIYKCISNYISTDEVIITDERIQHIKESHPGAYEHYSQYIKKMIEEPQ